ncbi:MAG: enoyl-CoA hydratase/isomerase family protein [Pseudomonadota bacterium]|jgi:enoyl-CoA hydratase/carnithine racemase|nr:enoyl-CoA hydratase/isomerase family protein [Pseudomonadota bacterium]|tara:strand:+ start:2977 stop:3822 length:846 start_codon:yes stop_codon:yes gene_type:complete
MARKLKSFSRPKGGTLKKSYNMIIAKRRKGALEIQFNRPDRLNAINEEMAEEIMHAMDAVELDRKIIAVVLSGDQRSFCAGADLGGFQDLPEDRYDNYRARYNQRKNRLLYRFFMNYTKPVISAVEGYCLGGGFEMAMMGDIIIASESASFGLPEGRHSLIPGAGGTQNLPRLIGAPLAKEMIWTGRRISGAEAKEYRIVNHVVEQGKALVKVREIVEEMKGVGPLATMMTKQTINRGMDMTLQQGFLQEADLAYMLSWSDDRTEGLKAFSERRKPNFKGQ